jgi:hypothetical protein
VSPLSLREDSEERVSTALTTRSLRGNIQHIAPRVVGT